MTARVARFTAAVLAAFLFLGCLMLAPSAAADEPTECPEGFFLARFDGVNTCQPIPTETPVELEEPVDAPTLVEPEPVAPPAVPDVTGICTKGESVPVPTDPPWLYDVHWDEVGNSGFVYAYQLVNGEQEWWFPVWEFTYPGPNCAEAPVPAPGAPSEPEPAAPEHPDELAATGVEAGTWALLAGGLGLVAAGILAVRRVARN